MLSLREVSVLRHQGRAFLQGAAAVSTTKVNRSGLHVSCVTARSTTSPLFGAASAKLKRLTDADSDSVTARLAAIVGDDKKVSRAAAVRSQHGQDEGPDKGVSPDVVVFPGSVEEVSEICKLCNEDSIPLIPHGTGTGLEAGISALHGGVCLDLSAMDAILDYNPDDFDVTVQPGIIRSALNHHVKGDGLWFPVDPGADPSICGMCATGASGTNAVRYGTMKENAINLEVVLADGTIVQTSGKGTRPRKSSAGYNLTNMFVGSEGTLGVITKATVRLHAVAESIAAAVVSFPNIQAAVDTVVATLQCSVPIARVEFLDSLAIKANNAYNKMDMPEEPTLFLEFHAASEAALESQTQMVADISNDMGGSEFQWAVAQEERNRLWTARHKLHYASLNLRPGSRSVITDVCVPVSKLPEMVIAAREDIDKYGITGPLFGHVGDGNFHTWLLFDPEEPEEYKACKEVAYRMASRALKVGGTCTGEHGIGTGKIRLLEEQYGPEGIGVMWTLKNALDPKGIFNPGKVLPGQAAGRL